MYKANNKNQNKRGIGEETFNVIVQTNCNMKYIVVKTKNYPHSKLYFQLNFFGGKY